MLELYKEYKIVEDKRFKEPYKLKTVTFQYSENGILYYIGETDSGEVAGAMVLRNAEELVFGDSDA